MSDSPLNSMFDEHQGDPYWLLRCYSSDAKLQSKSYGYSESYYRWLAKVLTYPLVILSAVNTVLAGFHIHEFVLMGISLVTLILVGFNQAVNPKDKEHSAAQMRIEFGEIKSDITQFIASNHRTHDEIKNYASTVHELINTWRGIAPPIQSRFVERAKHECAHRSRRFKQGSPTGGTNRRIEEKK